MEKNKNKTLRITDTTLRDAHQSLWATRMRTEDIIDIIDTIDTVGYYSLEVWGGATFDVCLRFLRENPWERLRLIKAKAVKTPLQMLMRGQNIVGYKNYSDDLVERFVGTAHDNGVDIFRIFDALNDHRNLRSAIEAVKKSGAHAQGTLSYTISPVHTIEKYVNEAKVQVEMGIDSLCIKDMAGLLSPTMANNLVLELNKHLNIPIQIHAHATSGMACSAYLDGVRAGAGAIDCAVSSMAGFSSQPPVETMLAIFDETEFDVHLNVDALRIVNQYFLELGPKRSLGRRSNDPIIDSEILVHQIPGGMISNFRSQLEQQGALDKLPEVLAEVSRVRKDLGYPPLVTPTSQIVGTQAVMNIICEERYKIVPQEVKNYVKGLYGKSPVAIEAAFIKKILGDEKPIDYRPADDLEDTLPTAGESISDPTLITNEEDILSYCLFPEVALEFFKWRAFAENERPKTPADIELEELNIPKLVESETLVNKQNPEALNPILHPDDYSGMSTLIATASNLQLNELTLNKGDFSLSLRSGAITSVTNASVVSPSPLPKATENKAVEASNAEVSAEKINANNYQNTIDSIMAGTFYHASGTDIVPFVAEGSVLEEGDIICIIEAMKLFNEISAPSNCKIVKVLVSNGDLITKGQPLMAIEYI
ncbi:MAG TPA: pyruvate carboxylase subunit B [Methylococcaceae bacterium]|jgi:oxaloacetate decarboxylase alpha subunit|nr:pyruvate carboxylase subunit B [Methylococcaceae bacterium]HIA45659.1 pyruvate carboxylase subunit B [Methylococcaceae bacterium]HIN68494.1 pyruvate carboxylase subunit B [Methylococcales bacterium]HIO44239.1 pyruvate carboxylase subunit B [Methylococcales bacterium]